MSVVAHRQVELRHGIDERNPGDVTSRPFDLAYLTGLEEAPELQHMVAYALWVVSQLDDQWWSPDGLAERLLPPGIHRAVAQRRPVWDGFPLSPTYLAVRWLLEPFGDFGLLESRTPEVEPPKESRLPEFRKTPLAGRFLRFDFGPESPRARGSGWCVSKESRS